jgi:hypothetical protein
MFNLCTAPVRTLFVALLMICPSLSAAPIRFLAWDESITTRKLSFSDGKELTELDDLHPHKRSKPLNWTVSELPPGLLALDRSSADGKPISAPIKLSPDLKAPLVLILPDPKHPSGIRCFVIDEDTAGFTWGTLRFINATGKELLVKQDKEIKALPETWKAVDIAPGGSMRNIGIQMASRADLKSVLYSAVWEHDPDVRKLIIVVPGTDAQSGSLNLKIIPEDRRALAPVSPASNAGADAP